MLRYYCIITLPPILILRPCATNLLTLCYVPSKLCMSPPDPLGQAEMRQFGATVDQAVRVQCQTFVRTKTTETTPNSQIAEHKKHFLLWSKPERRTSCTDWNGRVSMGQGVRTSIQILAFHPLWQQELTTTPNWGTKTNLGFGRPVSQITLCPAKAPISF